MKTTTENIYGIIDTRTIQLYEFHELCEDAQNRVISEYMIERENDPYFAQYFADCYESEIWECVYSLEKSLSNIGVKWSYNPWYSADFDIVYRYNDCSSPDELTPVDDNDICYSMDLCDAWNAHVHKLNAICHRIDYLAYLSEDLYPIYDIYYNEIPENAAFSARADDMHLQMVDLWYMELEKACDDVRNTIETLLRGEWEWYASEECARDEYEANQTGEEYRTCEYPYYKNGGYTGRIYYSDSRKWYTAAGELYEQSKINHECVSIVKTR